MQRVLIERKSLGVVALLATLVLLGITWGLAGCGSSSPIGIAFSQSSLTVDGSDSVKISVTLTNDSKAAGVTWTATGGTLSNQTTTSVTFTAPAATASAQTATVTATSVSDTTKSQPITITIPAAPAVSTGSLAAATVGTPYSVTLAGSGGISPYTWALSSGTLPASITLTSAGVLAGTPMATDAGTYNLTFKVTDSGTPTALTSTKALTLTISAAPAIAFATTSLANATYKVAYSATVSASGGAGTLTYNLSTGPLPAGLTLSPAGVISGTPTAAGTFPIAVTASDAFGDSQPQALSLKVVYPALAIAPASLPTAYVNSNYSQTFTATGGSGTGYSYGVASGTSLPAGLTLSPAGVLSGKPTTSGSASFGVTVTDSASNTNTATYTLTINPAVSFTTATTLPTAYVGSNYSQTLAATGGSGTGYTFAVASGSSLPAGLALSSAGVLSGKPTTAGAPTFGVTVTDSASNTATATFSLTISPGVSITPITLPAGYQGTAYPGATFTATGGSGTGYTWAWAPASGSTLPAGIGLSTAGVVAGTPTAAGTFNLVVTATDSVGNTASTNVTLTVQATLTVTSTTLPSGTINVAYSQSLAATGGSGTGYTWTTDAAGTTSLAALKLTLASSGAVTGTPTATGTATFNATVTDSVGHTATAAVTVAVYSVLTVTTTALPSTDAGVAYAQTLAAGGGSGTGYTWSVTAGAASLAAENLSVSTTGAITGTPSATGTATFTVQVKDSLGNTAPATFTIQVYGALSLSAPSTTVPGPATVGGVYYGAINATGGSGTYTWTITGLPSDSLSANVSGALVTITGTPTTATTVTFTASVTDTATSQTVGPDTYSIVVSNPSPLTLPAPNPATLPSATVNQTYSGVIQASGGAGPYSWTVNGVAVTGAGIVLSNGLTASNTGNNTLQVNGTPTTTTAVPLTSVAVKDNTGATAGPTTYSIAVNAAGSQVGGQISLTQSCGSNVAVPPITVSINTSPVQTTTTSNGSYSFASIPNGTYTLTPSIAGANSIFYPATQSITVNNGSVTANFTATIGYTVSGNVSYSGTNKGQVYLVLSGGANCNGSSLGTSITEATLTSGGAFTIRGVPPSSNNYSLRAAMDPIGSGQYNLVDPSGSTTTTVSNANVTGVSVTMTDPTVTTPTSGPKLNGISPTDQGVLIAFKPIRNTSGVEEVSSYTVQWSTSSSFSSPSSATFTANGDNTNVWILNNTKTGISGSFTNGTAYYFRACGNAGGSCGPWTVWGGGTPAAVTAGAPSGSGYFTVTGTVTLPSNITPTGPLYVGYFDEVTRLGYGTVIASPSNTSANAFTVQVPSGTNYFFFGILDQNKNGIVDAGDVSNVMNAQNAFATSITGNMTGQNLTLSGAGSVATVTTQNIQSTFSGGSSASYALNLSLGQEVKLPVSATLTAGPNVLNPIDLGESCFGCGNIAFGYYIDVNSAKPTVGDTYSFLVNYSDGTSETVTASVTGLLTGFATALSPTGSVPGNTTPTFTWTYPASASSYVYRFFINDNNGTIWQVPGNNANLIGFPSTVTSIVWG
ncbi:MAG: putative Ig domain-containing protein, partial [Acidobacteriota bacterium]|nr:putative Ig domain-containing protein [Acidobacteriota bacterium]